MAQSVKSRECPAVGHEISSTECGEKRGSQYACPAHCPFNPLAPENYLSLLTLENEVDKKSVDWLIQHRMGREAAQRFSEPHHGVERHARFIWQLFLKPDAAGRTSGQHWEQAGFTGLNNDERVLLRAKMNIRILLTEVHRIRDEQQVEVVDLLNPGSAPLLVLDRKLAETSVRFATYLSWGYPLPHFWRLSGAALMIPIMGDFEPVEIITEILRHLGGPAPGPALPAWLGEHFERFGQSLEAVARAREQRLFASIDAQFGKAVYELQAPLGQCREALDARSKVVEEPPSAAEIREGFSESRIWLADPDPLLDLPEQGRLVLGRVLLGQLFWRLEAVGEARLKTLRERFEACLGSRVRFAGERRDDLAKQIISREPPYDARLVPPRLLEKPEQLLLYSSVLPQSAVTASLDEVHQSIRQAQDRAFLDMKIPLLEGHTPREAAKDPALRPKLIHLLKNRVRMQDEQNLRSGEVEDMNWLLRDLGADELIFDPPPRRLPLEDEDSLSEDENSLAGDDNPLFEEDEDPWENIKRTPPPPLPAQRFTVQEASARLATVMETFDTARDALAEMERSGSFMILDLREFTEKLLTDEEFNTLIPFLVQAWFMLIPPGSIAPPIQTPALFDNINQALRQLVHEMEQPQADIVPLLLEGCQQPHVLKMITFTLTDVLQKEGGPNQVSPTALATFVTILKELINAIDRALRG